MKSHSDLINIANHGRSWYTLTTTQILTRFPVSRQDNCCWISDRMGANFFCTFKGNSQRNGDAKRRICFCSLALKYFLWALRNLKPTLHFSMEALNKFESTCEGAFYEDSHDHFTDHGITYSKPYSSNSSVFLLLTASLNDAITTMYRFGWVRIDFIKVSYLSI